MAEYIEREVAIEEIKAYAIRAYDIDLNCPDQFAGSKREEQYCEGLYEALERIADADAIPAADVAPVVYGRWEEKQELLSWCEDDADVFWECSVCKARVCGESNYCPNCGARMDGDG